MFCKTLNGSGGSSGTIDFAICDGDPHGTPLPNGLFSTEDGRMIVGVNNKAPLYVRLNRNEVVQMARFFAEAASKMDL